MNGYDISNYTLDELKEAFASIDDKKYPDRAIQLYIRMKALEKNRTIKESEKEPSFVNFIKKTIYKYLGWHWFSTKNPSNWFLGAPQPPILLEDMQYEYQQKVKRVELLMSDKSIDDEI